MVVCSEETTLVVVQDLTVGNKGKGDPLKCPWEWAESTSKKTGTPGPTTSAHSTRCYGSEAYSQRETSSRK